MADPSDSAMEDSSASVVQPTVTPQRVPMPDSHQGYLIGWAVNTDDQPIKWDGLIGDAMIRDPDTGSPTGYNAPPIPSPSDSAAMGADQGGFGSGSDGTDSTPQTFGGGTWDGGGSEGDWSGGPPADSGASSWRPTTDYSDNPNGPTFGGGDYSGGGGSGGEWGEGGGPHGGVVTASFETQPTPDPTLTGLMGPDPCPPSLPMPVQEPQGSIDYQNTPGLCT